jgi:hypothetical protein
MRAKALSVAGVHCGFPTIRALAMMSLTRGDAQALRGMKVLRL